MTIIGIWGVRALGVYLFAWELGLGLPQKESLQREARKFCDEY